MHRRVEYIVYPPNYSAGDGFKRAWSWRQAKKLVIHGSEVHRCVHVHPRPRASWTASFVSYVWCVDSATNPAPSQGGQP